LILEFWVKLFVDLLKDISWELTLLVSLFYFRRQIKELLNAVVERGITIKPNQGEIVLPPQTPVERPTAKPVEDDPSVPKSNHTRLAHSLVTLSAAKGLKYRFFAALRMTFLEIYIVKCTNVMWSDLAFRKSEKSKVRLGHVFHDCNSLSFPLV
jgi:hypothetical protein